jgi:ABC-type multidrug transport system fused ATPase/permease subunit
MDAGKIVEAGSYNELMDKKGLFAEMAARQLVDGEA